MENLNKKIYCVKCGQVNELNNIYKYCYKCGCELAIHEEDKVAIATKEYDSLGSIITGCIIIPILLIGFAIFLSCVSEDVFTTIIFMFIGFSISFAIDFSMIHSYSKNLKYPEECIYYNQKLKYLDIYTGSDFRQIPLEKIKKVYEITGRYTTYGNIIIKSKSGEKITSVCVGDAYKVKKEIKQLIKNNV